MNDILTEQGYEIHPSWGYPLNNGYIPVSQPYILSNSELTSAIQYAVNVIPFTDGKVRQLLEDDLAHLLIIRQERADAMTRKKEE